MPSNPEPNAHPPEKKEEEEDEAVFSSLCMRLVEQEDLGESWLKVLFMLIAHPSSQLLTSQSSLVGHQ